MFDRTISLVGEECFSKFKNTTVLVVGLGGVGGYSVEALVRSGIGNIILIDYDKIDITNLNRQIITNSKNVGFYKTEEFKKRILDINPLCNVIIENIFLNSDNMSLLNKYNIDYIIDACDSVNTKKKLIDYSLEHDIKLISCMGTAKKIDISKLKIMDIRKTSYDPLAKVIRKYVNSLKTNKKIMVVSSDEKPSLNKELASMIFVPPAAGLMCASYVIEDIKKDN